MHLVVLQESSISCCTQCDLYVFPGKTTAIPEFSMMRRLQRHVLVLNKHCPNIRTEDSNKELSSIKTNTKVGRMTQKIFVALVQDLSCSKYGTVRMKLSFYGTFRDVSFEIGRASCRERVCQYV